MPDAGIRYPTPRMAQIRQREFVQRGERFDVPASGDAGYPSVSPDVTNLTLLEEYRRGGYQFELCLQWCEFW